MLLMSLHAQGHAIKNAKTQLSQCLHSLPARRRLIISGTPIQNRLGELWTLFDFACPVRPNRDISHLLASDICWVDCGRWGMVWPHAQPANHTQMPGHARDRGDQHAQQLQMSGLCCPKSTATTGVKSSQLATVNPQPEVCRRACWETTSGSRPTTRLQSQQAQTGRPQTATAGMALPEQLTCGLA